MDPGSRDLRSTLLNSAPFTLQASQVACDALVDLDGTGPFIVDWKSTGKSIHKSNESQLHNYRAQTGAYSLMLNHRTGIQAIGGAVVVARRSGSPTVELLNLDELKKQEDLFLERCADYLHVPSGMKYPRHTKSPL